MINNPLKNDRRDNAGVYIKMSDACAAKDNAISVTTLKEHNHE